MQRFLLFPLCLALCLTVLKAEPPSPPGDTLWSSGAHFNYINAVAFSPDGTLLASAGYDRTIRLWNTTTGTLVASLEGHQDEVSSLIFSLDGSRLYSSGRDAIKIWNMTTRDTLRTIPLTPDDGLHYITVGNTSTATLIATVVSFTQVVVFDANTGAEVHRIENDRSSVIGLALSPNGLRLAVGGSDGQVDVWDTQSWQVVDTHFSSAKIKLLYSPDGTRLLGVGTEMVLWIDNEPSPNRTFSGHTGNVHDACFSPNGAYIASAGNDKTVRIWSTGTGENTYTYTDEYLPYTKESVAISPNAHYIAVGSGLRNLYLLHARWGLTTLSTPPAQGLIVKPAFPNPAQSTLSMSVDVEAPLPLPASFELVLCNSAGETVATTSYRAESYGNHTIDIDTRGLATGNYFCTVRHNSTSVSQHLILQGE